MACPRCLRKGMVITSPGNGPRVALVTLGCKVNQAETEALARQLDAAGYQRADGQSPVEVYILNTCTVTHIADRKSRLYLRQARRRNPGALVIATGCYAQRVPQSLAAMAEVDLVIPNQEKDELAEIIARELATRTIGQPSLSHDPLSSFLPHHTRSLVKIRDGCNEFCSFCVVPWTRGRERSVAMEHVVVDVKARVAQGYREVVLTGPQIGAYGRDRLTDGNRATPASPGANLEALVRRLLAETAVERLRLSSVHPQNVTPGLVSLWDNERLCRHLHLALQSGSDAVLKRMNRRYTTEEYRQVVKRVREAVPDIAITTDLMVGFPGESTLEFEESYRFCQKMEFAAIHVFPYSRRPGTPAARRADQVAATEKKARTARMLELARRSAFALRQRWVGRVVSVLWEGERPALDVHGATVWAGLTDNYLKVYTSGDSSLRNRLAPMRITGHHGDGLWGEPLEMWGSIQP